MGASEAVLTGSYLRIAHSLQERGATAAMIGELDMLSTDLASAALMPLVRSQHDTVVDLAELSFCDCSGIRLFLELADTARTSGTAITFVHPRPFLQRLLAITGTDSILRVV